MKIQATRVFRKNHKEYEKGTRIVVNQGGRGSSKTYSLAQLFLIILYSKKNVLLTVCRKTLPALRATAMRDFFEIMKELGLYREERHNKTDQTYKIRGNEIEFISVDQPQKVRGRKRDYLWLNEANEFSYEDFRQLNLRTEKQIFMDFNPSDLYHWIYDNILTRDDCAFIKSYYKDNPFLDEMIVKEIEMLKDVDSNYWKVYGLGERGTSETTIYTNWEYIDALPEGYNDEFYGLDFGYNNPSALVKVVMKDKTSYIEEKLYESYLTNTQLIEKMVSMAIPKNKIIYCDSAEPQRIEELKKAGFNARPADKDVSKGIDVVKTSKPHITKNSVNILKEIKSYSWKQKNEQVLDEPVKANDHAMDAIRYALHTNQNYIKPGIFV